MSEFEIIQHDQIRGISLFFDTVIHRTAHIHPEFEIVLVLDGALQVNCGQSRYGAQVQDILIFHPNQPHELHPAGAECTFLCMQVLPECFTAVWPPVGQLLFDEPVVRPHMTPDAYSAVWQLLWETLEAYLERTACYELTCIGKLALALQQILTAVPCHTMSVAQVQQQDKRTARLQRLIDYVEHNYMNKIRLTDFAAQEGLTVNYVSGFIRESMNQTFQEYVNTVRFNAACQRIAAGEGRLTDICVETGFSDYRYFSRTFRAKLGITPEEYKRQSQPPLPSSSSVSHSAQSLERFYSREESLALYHRFCFLYKKQAENHAPC